MSTTTRWLAGALLAATTLVVGCPSKPEKKSCPTGQTLCLGNCVDSQTDESACGPGCARCPSGGTCVAGVCECPTGLTDCYGTCLDTQTSDANCGGCGQSCGLGTCTGGGCTCQATTGVMSCPPGWPRCVNTLTSEANCGACGVDCADFAAFAQCDAGSCACVAPRSTKCGTSPSAECVDLLTDTNHCSGCLLRCPTGADCIGGTCTCPAATPDVCGTSPGACVNLDADEGHCGTCTTACTAGQTCTTGKCCLTGQLACGSTSKICCNGSGCCGDGCQTQHSNGLGQSFYDCFPLGTHTLDAALRAADAWGSGADVDMSFTACPTGCYGRRNAAGTQYAIWCYDGSPYTGHVRLETAPGYCPTDLNPSWN